MRRTGVLDLLVFLAILLMCCMGCGDITGMPQRGLWVEDNVPIASALAACQTWAPVGVECVQAESRDLALVVVSDSHEIGCEPVGGTIWAGQGGRDMSPGYRDPAYPPGGWVHMHTACWDDLADPEFVALMAHEIGHALGIGHLPNPAAVMWAGGNAAMVLDADDIAAYWAAQP